MPDLTPEIYLPIAAALCAVIALLWKRVSDLYSELIQDSRSLETIVTILQASTATDGEMRKVLELIHNRLEEIHKHVSNGGSPPSSGQS